jgi:UDP-N-acetyl-D-mannosaminuronic acid dehydrogenase
MKIAVHGLGYIGLPTAALFAQSGLDVVGVDISPAVTEAIRRGAPETREPGVAKLIERVVAKGRLRVASNPEPANAHILCLPTPVDTQKRPLLHHIDAALFAVAPHLREGDLIIIESTVPPGTTEMLAHKIARLRPDLPSELIFLAHCPERAIPGAALREIAENERIIGGLCPTASEMSAELYRRISRARLNITDARTAELCKLAENAWRDTTIAFANELSLICQKQGVNVWRLINLANRHPRVDIPRPGPGVGGHCLAVDPWFLVDAAPGCTEFIQAARQRNDAMPNQTADRFEQALAHLSRPARIACLGLAYKPDTDDLRESPALAVAQILADRGHEVLVVEPHIDVLPFGLAASGARLISCEAALEDADAVGVLVAHSAFAARRTEIARHPVVVDAVGLFSGTFSDCPAIDEAGRRVENHNVALAEPAQDFGVNAVAVADLDRSEIGDPFRNPENRPNAVLTE